LNLKNNCRNGFPIPEFGKKHVSHLIPGQIAIKLSNIDGFSPSTPLGGHLGFLRKHEDITLISTRFV
jgi:hypothetical protein